MSRRRGQLRQGGRRGLSKVVAAGTRRRSEPGRRRGGRQAEPLDAVPATHHDQERWRVVPCADLAVEEGGVLLRLAEQAANRPEVSRRCDQRHLDREVSATRRGGLRVQLGLETVRDGRAERIEDVLREQHVARRVTVGQRDRGEEQREQEHGRQEGQRGSPDRPHFATPHPGSKMPDPHVPGGKV